MTDPIRRIEDVFGFSALCASKLFARDLPISYYVNAARLAVHDEAIFVKAYGVEINLRLHCLFVNTASAQCETLLNPRSESLDFVVDSGNKIHHLQPLQDHTLVIDQSFIELIHAIIFISICSEIPLTEKQLKALRTRIIFIACVRAGRYDLLANLGPSEAISDIISDALRSGAIGKRLLPAIQYIVSHEATHWIYGFRPKGFDIDGEHTSLRPMLEQEFESALRRSRQNHVIHYGEDAAEYAAKTLQGSIEHWLGVGWEEVLCDLQGFRSAITMAQDAEVKISSVIVAINSVHKALSCIQLAIDEIADSEEVSRVAARGLLAETISNLFLHNYTQSERDITSRMLSQANRRVRDLVAMPLEQDIFDLKATRSLGLVDARGVMGAYGFHAYKPGSIALLR